MSRGRGWRWGWGGSIFLKKGGDIKKEQWKKKGRLIHLSALWVHFGNSVLDNSDWDKTSDSLTKSKKNQYFEQSATLFGTKKNKNKRTVNQILLPKLWYRSDIYYFKIYQRGNWKNNSSDLHLEVWTKYFRHRYSIKLSRT